MTEPHTKNGNESDPRTFLFRPTSRTGIERRSTLLKAPHLNITLPLKNNAVRSVADRDVAPPRAASDGARELGELRFRDPRLPLLLTRWILNAGFGALRRLVPRDARADMISLHPRLTVRSFTSKAANAATRSVPSSGRCVLVPSVRDAADYNSRKATPNWVGPFTSCSPEVDRTQSLLRRTGHLR